MFVTGVGSDCPCPAPTDAHGEIGTAFACMLVRVDRERRAFHSSSCLHLRQRCIPHTSRRSSPEAPSGTRESPQRQARKSCSRRESPPIPAQAGSAMTGLSRRRSRDRSPVAPDFCLPCELKSSVVSLGTLPVTGGRLRRAGALQFAAGGHATGRRESLVACGDERPPATRDLGELLRLGDGQAEAAASPGRGDPDPVAARTADGCCACDRPCGDGMEDTPPGRVDVEREPESRRRPQSQLQRAVHTVTAREIARTTTVCGARSYRIRITATRGSGSFRLTVAEP